ncbi:MAG: RNA-binding protein [Halobacteria archaeon]|nr:RNA-binding protein [Halobacteria archaeon]
MEFHYVDLRCFCYATEDEERVRQALELFLPPDVDERDDIEVEESTTEGHYGDSILVFSVRLENADDVRYVMNKILESADIDEIEEELDERVDDDCTFHLRIDKQAAYNGEVRLGEGIHLSAKVEAYPAKHKKAVKAVRRSLFEEGGSSSEGYPNT